METFNILQAILSILSGLIVTIPLIIKLVKYVQSSIKEKNWKNLIKLLMSLMEEAEVNFSDGEERKKWVLQEVLKLESTLEYDIDINVVSDMIDALCEMAKIINVRG